MINVYIAGPYKNKERLKEERDKLEATAIFNSISTWLDETESPNIQIAEIPDAKLVEYSKRDIAEVKAADLFILDELEESCRGGREVEYGVALAMNKVTVIIGDNRNIFHRMATYHFDSWEAFSKKWHTLFTISGGVL